MPGLQATCGKFRPNDDVIKASPFCECGYVWVLHPWENPCTSDHPSACMGEGPDGVTRCLWCGDLSDLSMLVDHLSRTYDHFSHGRISKPNTLPEEVFRLAEEFASEDIEEAIKEHDAAKDGGEI